jgi:undecaprenyl diphosphate synthase
MHVAIIMDGNRRWAKAHGVPAYQGHQKGISRIKALVYAGQELGVKVMSWYGFSTENWTRSGTEINYLMRLFIKYIKTNLQELVDNNIQIRHIGRKDRLPTKLIELLNQAEEISQSNTGTIVNLALDYGGRDELLRACQKIIDSNPTAPVTEEFLTDHLDTAPHNNVDLVIRTSGESRISNFLLWQLAYAELFFTPVYFPDFSVDLFSEIIENYAKRNRRFGG